MEAQLLAADARFWAVPWAGGGGPVHVHAHGAFGKCADPSSAFVVNGHKSPAVREQKGGGVKGCLDLSRTDQ